jgi:RNA polymerase sigma factor (sigma-70 family)
MPVVDPTPTWVEDLSRHQVAESLPAAIMKLPDRQKRVVVWRYYEDRSFEDIAKLLNIEASTARSLLRHGLNNLRKQMVNTESLSA